MGRNSSSDDPAESYWLQVALTRLDRVLARSAGPVTVYLDDEGRVRCCARYEGESRAVVGVYDARPSAYELAEDVRATRAALEAP